MRQSRSKSIDLTNNSCAISSISSQSNTLNSTIKKELIEALALCIKQEDTDESWLLTQSNKDGAKCFYLGNVYIVDKPKIEEYAFENYHGLIQWKCSKTSCKGRAHSKSLSPPLEIINEHTHLPNFEAREVLLSTKKMKTRAKKSHEPPRVIITESNKGLSEAAADQAPRYNAFRQVISRQRDMGYGVEFKSLAIITIPPTLQLTFKNSRFYWDDSGPDDKNRIIIFSTKEKFDLLEKHRDWYCDGTFDISPTLFTQLYTIHIIINNKDLPMLYALLPNKKQKTYVALFKMIKKYINKNPKSINIDFEKAVMNSVRKVFDCKIYGCFFHLCQSIRRRVQQKHLSDYNSDPEFRKSYKMLKAIPFVAEDDVISAFERVDKAATKSLKKFYNYVERNYIGLLDKVTGKRKTPRFPIQTWNLYNRILLNLPRTNNSVESWHSQISSEDKKCMKLCELIEFLRTEQSNTENLIAQLKSGDEKKKRSYIVRRDKNLFNLVSKYSNDDIFDYLYNISLNFED